MSKKNLIAQNVIDSKLENKEEFSIEEVNQEIIDKGGIPLLNAGYSIEQCVENLVNTGEIFLSPSKQMYRPAVQLAKPSDSYFMLKMND